MNLMKIEWYGPEFKTAAERREVKNILKEYCGECDEPFRVFGMIYNAPEKKQLWFLCQWCSFYGYSTWNGSFGCGCR